MRNYFNILKFMVSVGLLYSVGAQANYESFQLSNGEEIKFMTLKPGSGDAASHEKRPDLAIVEANIPLTLKQRMSITVRDLKKMNQEQLDQIYGRITSGPIPAADFNGTILIRNEMVLKGEEKVLSTIKEKKPILGRLGIFASALVCGRRDKLECLGEFLWSGKRFYEPNEFGQVQLRNAINPWIQSESLLKKVGLEKLHAPLQKAQAQVFQDSSRLMLFPANVYCGLSLVDTRHESVIIDYAYGDDFTPYIPEVDGLVGRDGSWIRDEIRMIRPGLYLGRAYVDRIFLLNFVLEIPSKKLQTKWASDESRWKNKCWTGDSWH